MLKVNNFFSLNVKMEKRENLDVHDNFYQKSMREINEKRRG